MAVLQGIWILVLTLLSLAKSQDSFTNQELLRLHQLTASSAGAGSEQPETITGYNTNVVHRDPNTDEQSVSSVSVQFRLKEDQDRSVGSSRSDHRRKIFHIKNPFQHHPDDQRDYEIDSDPGASNQYASMQYTLPSEDFLKQMRAEGHLSQFSTPAPAAQAVYATTHQPQFFQSPAPGYDHQNHQNQISQQQYPSALANSPEQNSVYNFYGSAFASEGPSTPSPQIQFVSTPAPASQFVGTPNSPPYVSSQSPTFLTSQASVQYLSSPPSQVSTNPSDYANRLTVSPYDNTNRNVNLQIDHYNNAVNGVRFPFNGNGQSYQNESPTTTASPSSSSIFPEQRVQDWRNALNSGVEALSKSVQEYTHMNQYQTSSTGNSQPESGSSNEQSSYNGNNANADTHRIGNSLQTSNNLFMNFMQPEYQQYQYQNMRTRTRDLEQETGQPEMYSHGDYGWKLNNKRPLVSSDTIGASSYAHVRPQALPLQSAQPQENSYSKYNSPSQTSYQTDSQKQNVNLGYSIGLNSQRPNSDDEFGGKSSSSENVDTQEFAKAAAKAHENMKMQQSQSSESYYGHDNPSSVVSYAPSYQPSNNYFGNSPLSNVVSTYYGNTDKLQKDTKYYSETTTQTSFPYGYSQNDLVTALPYLYNFRNPNVDNKSKQPFDHAKALKNIVPIDVSNVVYTPESGIKSTSFGNTQRLTTGSQKEQIDQNFKHLLDQYKPLADAYYKDKTTAYGFNMKQKPENYISPTEGAKQSEILHYSPGKQNSGELTYGQEFMYDKRYGDNKTPQHGYQHSVISSYPNQLQAAASIQQNTYRPHDMSNMLRLNDIPYKLSQNALSLGLGAVNSYDPNLPPLVPGRINQHVGSHQLEPSNSLLSRLNLFGSNKQYAGAFGRPNELEAQSGNLMPTINGIRVANPFNVDLKVVSDMLRGKPTIDETRMSPLRDHYNRLLPMKMDMSSLQHIFSKGENGQSVPDLVGDPRSKDFNTYEGLAALTAKFREMESDGLGSYGNQFVDVLNVPRYPYQNQVKYSRSQEEEETVPAAEGSNTHPIGAVIEEDESNITEESKEEPEENNHDDRPQPVEHEHRPKINPSFNFRNHRPSSRHPNSLYSGRNNYHRKYPRESHVNEPYPLLKPPRPPRSRASHFKNEKRNRPRRLPKFKLNRMLKTQPLFESEKPVVEVVDEKTPVPIVLRPPPESAESKSDKDTNEN